MKKMARRLSIALLAVLMLTAFCVTVFAAGPYTPVTGVTVNVTESTSDSMTDGAVTVTAKGSAGIFGYGASAKTATIEIYNDSDATAKLSFDWTATSVNQLVIDGTTYSAEAGSFSKTMDAGDSFSITITTAKNSTENKLVMNNFAIQAAQATSNVTFEYDSALGSVTVGGSDTESGSSFEIASSGVEVTATAIGSSFLGWIDTADNSIVSQNATFTFAPSADMTLKAVFASSAPHFYVAASYLYDDLNAAASYAQSSGLNKVILANNGTLPAGDYTIPSGVTLLIPFDAANTLYTAEPDPVEGHTKPTVYRKLTMASGAHITVNGALSISGKHSATKNYNGMPSGHLGFIQMNTDSSITVNNGANLYAWGYIIGSGNVTVNSGGTVYECFQITDYRGGSATSTMAQQTNGVFPMSQYYLQNIEVPLKLMQGAVEKAYFSVTVTLLGIQSSEMTIIGSGSSMFSLSGEESYIIKDYQEGQGRTTYVTSGDVSVSPTVMEMQATLGSTTKIDSTNFNLPIASHMTVEAISGTVTINQDLALLPGSELIIHEDVKGVLGEGVRVIVYNKADWGDDTYAGYCSEYNKEYIQLQYVPGGDGTVGRSKDAMIVVNGTVDASAGAVYTTAGGNANIYSDGPGVVVLKAGEETVTYQVTQNDTETTDVAINIKPAVLKNADGSYVNTATNTYTYVDGFWRCATHTYDSANASSVIAPTCTTAGYTKHTCDVCGYSYTDNEVAALGHTEVTDAAVAATCTTAGKTEGKHCSVCSEVLVAQTEVAALGHTEVTDAAVAATCTTAGKTEGKHCSVCNEVLVAQEVVAANGHTEVVDAAVAATCTETGLTEGKHCSVCSTVLVAQEVVAALGHTEVTDAAVPATLGSIGWTEGSHCSVCDEVLVEQVQTAPLMSTEWSMTLSDDLSVNFYIDVDDSVAANTKITVSFNGAETVYNAGDAISVKVAATQMNDTITVTAVNGDDSVTNTYTVKQYAEAILTGDYGDTTKTMAQAMLNYGGAAQTYFGYNTGNLVSSEIVSVELPEADAMSVEGSAEGIKYYGATLVYREKIAVRFYFTGSSEGITFMVGEKKYEAVTKDGMCYVEIADILPQNLDQQITLTATDANGNTLTVTYGPMNYIVRMNAKGSEKLQNLMKALYSYHVAAKAL